MRTSRRGFMAQALAATAGGALACRGARADPNAATLIVGLDTEPLALTIASTDPGAGVVSVKIFDRLLCLDGDGVPQPQLAHGWSVDPDGLGIVLRLRPGVRWHDGTPFSSEDVAYSVMEVWKRYLPLHSPSYSKVTHVDTPDPLTAVVRLSEPVPYFLSSLGSGQSQVLPKHLYTGGDVIRNPHNTAPVGTGPFRFVRWERGSYIELERNVQYWDQPKPFLGRVIFRLLPDGSATAAALESGSIQLIAGSYLPLTELERLKRNPALVIRTLGPAFVPTMLGFGFNMRRPPLTDVRVRRAFAHAIDREFILRNIWEGYGTLSDSPIPPQFPQFFSADVPKYPYDPGRAEALLDEAGLKRGSDGVRFSITNDPKLPGSLVLRSAQYIRSSLSRVGIHVELRSEDIGQYLDRVFTRHDFDTITYATGTDLDPALGIQRFYWSRAIQPGVPFSNATYYSRLEVDRLLERAQVELDVAKRRALYVEVQRLVQSDLPCIPLIFPSPIVACSRRVANATTVPADNFATATLGR
jgi:peptide/nickel transport system substrate-binding protein